MHVACHRWVHKRTNGISGRLRTMLVSIAGDILKLGGRVECVGLPKFCYRPGTLGDIYLVPVVVWRMQIELE